MTTQTTTTKSSGKIVLGTEKYFLLSFNARKWGATSKIDRISEISDLLGLPENMIRASQSLLTETEALDTISDIKKTAITFIQKKGADYKNLSGFYLVKKSNISLIQNELNRLKGEYIKTVDGFISEKYPILKSKFKEEFPKSFDESKYPSETELKSKFKFDWKWIELSIESLESLKEIDPKIYKQEIDKFKSEIEAIKEDTKNLVASEIVKRISNLKSQCSDNRVNQNTLKSIFSFMERFNDVYSDILAKDRISGIVKEIQVILEDTDKDTFKFNDNFRLAVGEKMSEAVKDIGKIAKIDRSIDI